MERPAPAPPRLLYSVPEAAEQLRISVPGLNLLIASGEIASIKLGRRRLVPHDAIVDLIDSLR